MTKFGVKVKLLIRLKPSGLPSVKKIWAFVVAELTSSVMMNVA